MTIEEKNNAIEALRRVINNPMTPENIKRNAVARLDNLVNERTTDEEEKEEVVEVVEPTPKATRTRKPKESSESVVDAMLSTIRQLMLAQQGTGVDSFEVRKLIEDYLNKRKISLSELDSSVIEEIKKNQTVVLTLPRYDLQITLDKGTTMIPNIFAIIDDVLAGNNVYLIGEAGGGKAQPLSAKIATPKGWITFADVKVGDDVFGEDGNIYQVEGVYDRGEKDVFIVTTSDGATTECCDEHLWEIQTRNDRNKNRRGKVIPLSEIKPFTDSKLTNAYLPIAKPINFTSNIKPLIDPYVLGVLIGDGSLTTNSISICNNDENIINEVSSLLPKGVKLSKRVTQDRANTYGIVGENGVNVVLNELKDLNLLYKKSIDKHIPSIYLYGSLENRISLLQGLCDTDGYADATHFEFSTSSEKLSIDFAELVRSLGGTCKVTSRMGAYSHNGVKKETHISFRLSCVFPDEINPFRKSNKKYTHNTKYKVKRSIEKIEFKGKEQVRCIKVSNPSSLYLTDDYIVTHNTFTAEKVAEILNRDFMVLNCSQYTSPVEILGGQTIEGYKDGKLVLSWRDGKILILDEMPKLDPNTAGLLNDALAKSSKTRPNAYINSTNPSEPPIPRNENFAVIGTGNTYPNKPNPAGYVGNNQQDLSLLDRFSGSVYFVDYSDFIDQESCRYQFLYDMLVGNYHEYVRAIRNNQTAPTPRGLRTIIEANNMKNMALVSYRTIIAFRVAFEIELVRAIARSRGEEVTDRGKTVDKAYQSYLVAFPDASKQTLIRLSGYDDEKVKMVTLAAINSIIGGGEQGFLNTLTPEVKQYASPVYQENLNFLIAENYIVS
jgi:hypothetical protein